MTGERMTQQELLPLFEAARWAPSSFNEQPWRFAYVSRDDAGWTDALDVVNEHNRTWAEQAAVLTLLVSQRTYSHNDSPSYTHSFDTGAAWQNLALEATHRGYVAHAMNGFDKERAVAVFDVPETFRVETMIAIGKRGTPADLPDDLQDREGPSDRRPIDDIVFSGSFP